ncbi:MAG: dihydrolipoamide acetyltransferase family protein [Nocardioidaceae bacterium]
MSDFTMPSLGADMDAGTLLEWLVKPGDHVHRGEPIAVVDTDKAAVEIESFQDGVVDAVLIEPGTRVAVGTPLATVREEGAAAPAPAVPAPTPPTPPAPPPAAAPAGPPPPSPAVRHHAAEVGVDLAAVTGTGLHGRVIRRDVDAAAAAAAATSAALTAGSRPRVSPYARRLAGELGVDLARVHGPGGRVRAEDVRAAAQAATAPAAVPEQPTPTAPTADAVEARSPRTTVAALMSRSKREIPHYYVATTVDMQTVTAWLHRTNLDRSVSDRIVPAAALLRATALAARRMPELNGFWVDDGFVPGEDVHLGVAISVRNGALVAPALHHAADLDLATLMHRLRDLVTRARKGRLTRAELTEPTLTVTDLGDQGVEEVIGVIQPPQVALVGVGRLVERPWAVDGLLGVRPVVRLTLSGDHRATDGYTGARFLGIVDELLQHPEEL